ETGSSHSSRNASVERGPRQSDTSDSETTDIRMINHQPGTRDGRYDPNRFHLHFEKENKEDVERRKKAAREKILKPVAEKELEMEISQIYPEEKGLNFPRRPAWHYGLQREQLLRKEEKSFLEYLEALHSKNPPGTLSHFEHNLETWRQLWRVMEMSDVILLIVDIRHPVLQFPPALYHHITAELKKQIILVINKVDLCPAPLVLAWKYYLMAQFPHLHCVCFTSHPGQPYSTCEKIPVPALSGSTARVINSILPFCSVTKKEDEQESRMESGRRTDPDHESVSEDHSRTRLEDLLPYSTRGIRMVMMMMMMMMMLIVVIVDLSSWEKKIQRDAVAVATEGCQADEGLETVLMEHHSDIAMEMNSPTQELYKDGVLTLGCIGFPNVGKSSVLNSLVGRKVVSVSRTPGHTKYFQTYYLTPTVKLCDCPGLVFPSRVDKQLQVLAGIYPVSQLQEPYSSVGYLCERTDYLSVLKLTHPESLLDPGTQDWTAWDVCEAWAEKRGYKTAKAARNDVYRAANSLLRLTIDGRLSLCLRPPGFTQSKDAWESHPLLSEILSLQGRKDEEQECTEQDEDAESSSGLEEEDDDEGDAADGDDEDETTDRKGLTLNMFSVLGENECE
ncbi:hypothetical protein DNTS_007807, partial [Danionella cerebrum]